jgi:hypothetical protein
MQDKRTAQEHLDSAMLRLSMTGIGERHYLRMLQILIVVSLLLLSDLAYRTSALFAATSLLVLAVLGGTRIPWLLLRSSGEPNYRGLADEAIRQAAASLKDDELLSIAPKTRRRLHLHLQEVGPDIAVSMLRILESVGDEDSCRLAEQMARDVRTGHAVREAAARCAEVLRARIEAAHRGDNLLRAVDGTPSDALLRPAQPVGTPPEALLRPAERQTGSLSIPNSELAEENVEFLVRQQDSTK